MIKIALKHFIYEKCINVLFDGILNNFSASKNGEFKVGDRFHSIQVKFESTRVNLSEIQTTLYNCTIMDILQGTVLIQYHLSKRVFGGGLISNDMSRIPVVWRVNIENIKSYIRR